MDENMQNQGFQSTRPSVPPQQPSGPTPDMPPPAPVEIREKSSPSSVVGIIVIVLVLVLGGFYFWGKQLREETPLPEESDTSLLVPAPGNEGVDEMIVNEEGAADDNVVPAPSNEEEI